MPHITRLTLTRLMRCYQLVCDLTDREHIQTVTSTQIGEALEIGPTLVRKDFGSIKLKGLSAVGFDIQKIRQYIGRALGIDQKRRAVLLGVGHLGSSLLAYAGFAKFGLAIVAAFDNDAQKTGRQVSGFTVRPVEEMEAFIKKRDICLAILTTPMEVAQQLADRLVAAGIMAIWNFSPKRLAVPQSVFVRNEHVYLSIGISEIAYHLKKTKAQRWRND